MEQIDMKQLEKDFKQQYERLLDVLFQVMYANRELSLSDISDGERLESAHTLAFKFYCHALTLLYLSNGTNQELPSLKWAYVDFASIDVITRAALEAFLIFHHVFFVSVEQEEKDYRYLAYEADGMADRQSMIAFIGVEKEKQRLAAENKELSDKLALNQIFQSLSPSQKRKVFEGKGMWRLNPITKNLLSWRDIGLKAGFSKFLASYIYSFLCASAHSTGIGIRQTFPTLNKREEEHLYAGTVAIMNVVTANLIREYCELFSKAQAVLGADSEGSSLVEEWIQSGRRLDKLMGTGQEND